jgi:glycosyltransferase involved in cell wall biosynthesis
LQREPNAAIRFYIVGGPIYTTRGSQFSRDELEKLAREISINDAVGFVPFQNDPVAIYRSLDVVVHASARPEPFGLCIAEAMACGRAVIVSAAGGARELFENGSDALAVDSADADALAEPMLRLSHDPQLRVNLGKSARITARARFDRGRLGPALLRVYRDLVR